MAIKGQIEDMCVRGQARKTCVCNAIKRRLHLLCVIITLSISFRPFYHDYFFISFHTVVSVANRTPSFTEVFFERNKNWTKDFFFEEKKGEENV